jgi:hypothetical protein
MIQPKSKEAKSVQKGGGGGSSGVLGFFSKIIPGSSKSKQDSSKITQAETDQAYLSCEEVDSDDLDGDLNLSDNEEMVEARQKRKKRREAKGKKTHKYRQEIDTNVFKISFGNLGSDEINKADGTILQCEVCGSFINKYSKIE